MVLNEIAMAQQVCMDWSNIHEEGPPHQRSFTLTLKMGQYEAVGAGNSKKIAKATAAQNMYQTIPDEWKVIRETGSFKRKSGKSKRKKPMPDAPGAAAGPAQIQVVTSTNTTMDSIEIPGEKKLKLAREGEQKPGAPSATVPKMAGTTPIYSVIQTANPISALFEYCKRGEIFKKIHLITTKQFLFYS